MIYLICLIYLSQAWKIDETALLYRFCWSLFLGPGKFYYAWVGGSLSSLLPVALGFRSRLGYLCTGPYFLSLALPSSEVREHELAKFDANRRAVEMLERLCTMKAKARIRTSLLICTDVFCFGEICSPFFGDLGSLLTLSAAGHAGDPPVRHGASLGPGRAPWRVLWAFKDAKSGK